MAVDVGQRAQHEHLVLLRGAQLLQPVALDLDELRHVLELLLPDVLELVALDLRQVDVAGCEHVALHLVKHALALALVRLVAAVHVAEY